MPSAHAQPDCVFCGYREAPVHLQRPDFAIRHCPHCAVLWCDPTRFERAVEPRSETAYLDATVHTENATRLHHLIKHAPAESHPRLLEIGCMRGDFVLQARGAGYRARGVDSSKTTVEQAKRVVDELVELGTLDEHVADASLDVIAAFNVVQDMDRPDQFLAHVVRALRPGGVLIVETPAQESIYHHVLFLRGRVKPQGRFEVGVLPGTHVFKFGRRAWRTILADRGFEILEASPRSTPMKVLLAKHERDPIMRAGIVGFGLLGRLTGWENRVLVVARRR